MGENKALAQEQWRRYGNDMKRVALFLVVKSDLPELPWRAGCWPECLVAVPMPSLALPLAKSGYGRDLL